MKTKVTIDGVEYNIDLEKAKELGLVETVNSRCKSWEEFKNKYLRAEGFLYNSTHKKVFNSYNPIAPNEQLTKHEAIAINAFSKLLKLRRDWIGDWNPDWSNDDETKYCVVVHNNEFCMEYHYLDSKTFSFPTKEMANEFFECFKKLFEECKYLI